MKKNFIFVGKGGQGLIFLATILSYSAINNNLYALQTQLYTAAQRGDISKAEVIISDYQIDYPKIENPDYFIALAKNSLLKFKSYIKDQTVIIYDNTYEELEDYFSNNKVYKLPFTKLSFDNFNKAEYANMIILGFLIKLIALINEDSVIKSLEKIKRDFEKNKKAFFIGRDIFNDKFSKKEVKIV